jgi:hypothetical protein
MGDTLTLSSEGNPTKREALKLKWMITCDTKATSISFLGVIAPFVIKMN